LTVIVVLSVALLAGCGGGGGGGSSSTTGGETFSGTLVNTINTSGAAGYTIRFDSNGPSTVTNSSGAFSLIVPSTDINPSGDTISALNGVGTVVGSTAITNDSSGATGLLIYYGPPPTPPLAIKQ
jgi:hypothetical protein